MFKKPVNYFYEPKKSNEYKAVQETYEWQTITPPDNLPEKTLKFLKEIKQYKKVSHNFQQDINDQIFYTPEQIQKFGIKLDSTNLQYQKEDIKNFNATDLRKAAKEITQDEIKKAAEKQTNEQILKLQKQINELQKNKSQNQKNEGKNS